MIRSKDELFEALAQILTLGAQFGTFYLLYGLSALLEGDKWGPLWDVVAAVLSALAAALVPALLWFSPTITLRWTVDKLSAQGIAQVDLRDRPRRKFTFRSELYGDARSLLAYLVRRRIIRNGIPVVVEFIPSGNVRLSLQTPDGGATRRGDTMLLRVNDTGRTVHQSSFFGSISTPSKGSEYTVGVSATLGDGAGWFLRHYVKVRSEVTAIRLME